MTRAVSLVVVGFVIIIAFAITMQSETMRTEVETFLANVLRREKQLNFSRHQAGFS